LGRIRVQAMQIVAAWAIGVLIGSGVLIVTSLLLGIHKYRLYQKYINQYKITDRTELNEELRKYGFNISCECKPTLADYFDASESNNKIVILHWLRLIPVHGKKIGPIKVKTVHEKKDSFNNVFKSIHNRNKKRKDIREPYTNA
jgi:hypothetical protein